MAEFLIYAKNNTHSDAAVDQAGCYKRGDIVVVKPDGWSWGKEETLPTFFVLKIPGIDAAKAEKYINTVETDTGLVNAKGQAIIKLTRRRAFSLDVDNVPAAVKTKLLATGTVTATWAQVRAFLFNKESLVNESSVDVSLVS